MIQTLQTVPETVNENQTLASYVRQVPQVLPTIQSQAVHNLFRTTSAESIVVCDEFLQVQGMVMKTHFYKELGQRFGTQLFLGRPIALLMDDRPLIVTAHMNPMEIIDLALSRTEEKFYDAVVVTKDDKFFGILTMRDILGMSRIMQQLSEGLRKDTLTRAKEMVERIRALVSQVVDATDEGRNESSRMTMFTSEGRQVIEEVNTSLNTFLTLNHHQQAQIDVLASRIESIQEITQIISQFAGQSRLLTLNAQIEAARAGQYGRGFRVIANEIGQLSDLIQRKAIDVDTITSQIVQDIRDILKFNEDTRRMSGQTSDAVEVALRVFNDLFESVSTQNGNVNMIRAYANDAYAGSNDVTRSIDQLTQA